MKKTISPSFLQGSVHVPSSKSFAHRQLIASALAQGPTTLRLHPVSADIAATMECLKAMGCQVISGEVKNEYVVVPFEKRPTSLSLFCNESGSTLRFLLPVTAALGIPACFTGAGRLPLRPNKPLLDVMRLHGVHARGDGLPLELSGQLSVGMYAIPGNVSSQYITGLLLALPLLKGNSQIRFTTPLESAAYLDITVFVLRQFGISVLKTENGYDISGGQAYQSPAHIETEGDWSSAVFWYCANKMGHHIDIQGLRPDSCQGDRQILQQLDALGGEINVSQTPDSLPALAVAACIHPGITCFTGAGRLRIKESDRLTATAEMLRALGQRVDEKEDGLVVYGGNGFAGGSVNGYGDHRIVMAAALAASRASAPVMLSDAEAIEKSYPCFFEDFTALGGIVHG